MTLTNTPSRSRLGAYYRSPLGVLHRGAEGIAVQNVGVMYVISKFGDTEAEWEKGVANYQLYNTGNCHCAVVCVDYPISAALFPGGTVPNASNITYYSVNSGTVTLLDLQAIFNDMKARIDTPVYQVSGYDYINVDFHDENDPYVWLDEYPVADDPGPPVVRGFKYWLMGDWPWLARIGAVLKGDWINYYTAHLANSVIP